VVSGERHSRFQNLGMLEFGLQKPDAQERAPTTPDAQERIPTTPDAQERAPTAPDAQERIPATLASLPPWRTPNAMSVRRSGSFIALKASYRRNSRLS
jgi:hypothetical protein